MTDNLVITNNENNRWLKQRWKWDSLEKVWIGNVLTASFWDLGMTKNNKGSILSDNIFILREDFCLFLCHLFSAWAPKQFLFKQNCSCFSYEKDDIIFFISLVGNLTTTMECNSFQISQIRHYFAGEKIPTFYAVKKSPLNKGFLNYILDPLDSILENIWTLETLIFIFSWSTCQEKIKFCWSYPFKCCALVAILKELYICLFHPINNCIMESIW